jgi:uncharacterized sporulation protein YeaH/YhbH (DUF444 family)
MDEKEMRLCLSTSLSPVGNFSVCCMLCVCVSYAKMEKEIADTPFSLLTLFLFVSYNFEKRR